MNKKLVILSVPFQRLNRVLLGPPVLGLLREQSDVVIVSPFADNPLFQQEFSGKSVSFLQWNAPERMRQPFGKLYALSELLRVEGYWRRNRNNGMACYIANSHTQFGLDGKDKKLSFFKRMISSAISRVGVWQKAWRVIDHLVGPSVFRLPKLQQLSQNYEQVVLIQSASWGMQDRMLAWMARQLKWRTVMVPYTTDQLMVNGYLMSDFDVICVQGPAEDGFAKRLHNVPSARVKRLGSAWLRYVELIQCKANQAKMRLASTERKTIMFAGVSTTYFPKQSQYEIIEELLHVIDAGAEGMELVLRPVAGDELEKNEIITRYGNRRNIKIQWPQASCLNLQNSLGTERMPSMEAELSEFIGQLQNIDLVVMASFTSLAIDAAYLKIPSIAVFADKTELLKRRFTNLIFDFGQILNGFTDLPIFLHQLDQLTPLVQTLLADPQKSRELANQVVKNWDYPDADFNRILLESIGESC